MLDVRRILCIQLWELHEGDWGWLPMLPSLDYCEIGERV